MYAKWTKNEVCADLVGWDEVSQHSLCSSRIHWPQESLPWDLEVEEK